MAQGADHDHLVKLFFLGASEVGKSSLVMRFCEDRFEDNFMVTIGVDCKSKYIDRSGWRLKLQVWDTAGHERFRTITPAYYRGAMGVIITYDVTSRESFDHVEFWVQQLNEHGDASVQRVLVGNKTDLADARKVTTEEGELLASKFGMAFFETSARTGERVEDTFLNITDQVVVHRYGDTPADVVDGKKFGPGEQKQCCSV